MMKKLKIRKTKGNTGAKGIHLHKSTGKYEARFTFGSERVYLGSFKTMNDAIVARLNYIVSLA